MARPPRALRVRAEALVAAVAVWSALPVGACAQKLDDLQTPPSPGFAILGLSPTVIERPTTPKALGIGLVSATQEGTVIPESYAVELAPYWLAPRPLLTFSQAYRPSFWQGVKQSFAVSVATDRTSGADSTRLGIGARVQLLSGRPSLRADAAEDSLRALMNAVSDLANDLDHARTHADSTDLQGRISSLEVLVDTLSTDFRQHRWNDRSGIRWEIAGAVASRFPSATFAGGDLTAWGLWSTLSFRPTARNADVLVLVRYQRLDATPPVAAGAGAVGAEGQQVVDAGARVIYGSGALYVSGECLGRVAFHTSDAQDGQPLVRFDNSYQVTGTVQYRIRKNLAVEWTFGRGFAVAGTDAGKLISLLGLKWALGQGVMP